MAATTFTYRARDRSGKVHEGEIEGSSREAVVKALREKGVLPLAVEQKKTGGLTTEIHIPGLTDRIKAKEVAVFSRQFATMINAGLSLLRSLSVLEEQTDSSALRKILGEVRRDVERGVGLSTALEKHPKAFNKLYTSMVKAGEASGALDSALARLAEFMERSRELRDSVLSALLYPVVLVVVGILSMAVILGLVIPKISQMFAEAGQQLPWFTRVVVAAGGFVENYWWLMALGFVGIYIFMRRQYADPVGRSRWDGRLLRLPLVGALIARLEAARFTRTLGTLLGNGVPLLDAIAIAKEVVANQVIAEGIRRVTEQVRQGEGLARPLTEARVFPPLAGHLMQVGEESGNLEAMLMQLAQIYEREVQSALRRLMAVLEPTLILGLAVVIAAIILSVVMAILSINNLAF